MLGQSGGLPGTRPPNGARHQEESADVAGVVAGRLTKGAVAAQSDSSNGSQDLDTYYAPPVTAAPPPGPGYGQQAVPGSGDPRYDEYGTGASAYHPGQVRP